MIPIAVCDDNVPVADQIRQIWEAEAGKFWKGTQTEVFYDAESLIRADQEKVFDIYIRISVCPEWTAFRRQNGSETRVAGMKPYLYKMKMQILVQLIYRFDVFATLAADDYMVCSFCRARYDIYLQCAGHDTKRGAGGQCRHGADQACSLLGLYLSQDIGSVIVIFFLRVIPVVVLGGMSFGLSGPAGGTEFGNMAVVLRTVIAILSGSMVPLWFFRNGCRKSSHGCLSSIRSRRPWDCSKDRYHCTGSTLVS